MRTRKNRRLRPSELRRLRLIVRRTKISRPNRRARCWFANKWQKEAQKQKSSIGEYSNTSGAFIFFRY